MEETKARLWEGPLVLCDTTPLKVLYQTNSNQFYALYSILPLGCAHWIICHIYVPLVPLSASTNWLIPTWKGAFAIASPRFFLHFRYEGWSGGNITFHYIYIKWDILQFLFVRPYMKSLFFVCLYETGGQELFKWTISGNRLANMSSAPKFT